MACSQPSGPRFVGSTMSPEHELGHLDSQYLTVRSNIQLKCNSHLTFFPFHSVTSPCLSVDFPHSILTETNVRGIILPLTPIVKDILFPLTKYARVILFPLTSMSGPSYTPTNNQYRRQSLLADINSILTPLLEAFYFHFYKCNGHPTPIEIDVRGTLLRLKSV